jgi:hypothetical protein
VIPGHGAEQKHGALVRLPAVYGARRGQLDKQQDEILRGIGPRCAAALIEQYPDNDTDHNDDKQSGIETTAADMR